ncbi:hypothetical protein E8E13_000187 [Curvularia kusanoi]|uniref:Alcohol dehydrogenase-like C-terminal domain-containing protein n=1 Tax=Curvularia kusanoi TaxID=90978 RepID=A0A9P4T2T5_CURKU|nr:hypothetical protein E8E13_000187 [Curvularia kusanoi]
MATHKALVLEEFGKPLVIKDVLTPSVTPGSALVAPLYAWVPHTLPMVFSGALKDLLPTFPPYVAGYSCVARVIVLPEDATTLRVGDLVWVDHMIRARDNPDLEIVRSFDGGRQPSTQVLIKGIWKHGSYGEKLLAPLEGLFKIPDVWVRERILGGMGISVQDFALSGYYLLALGGLATSGVRAGDRVIIAPATGKYSSAAVRVALALGCKVVATGRSAEKLKMLEMYHGAKDKLSTVALTGDADGDTKALRDAIGGEGADLFVDYSPTTMSEEPPHLKAGMNSLKRGGEYLLIGGAFTDFKISYAETMRRELRIRGKFMWQREHVELFLRLIDTGSLRLDPESGWFNKVRIFKMAEVEAALNDDSRSEHEDRLFAF